MKKLDHRNLATLYEVIENAKTDKIYIVMQYCSGGQIIDWDE
jgi:serine/threonine protein kinase